MFIYIVYLCIIYFLINREFILCGFESAQIFVFSILKTVYRVGLHFIKLILPNHKHIVIFKKQKTIEITFKIIYSCWSSDS